MKRTHASTTPVNADPRTVLLADVLPATAPTAISWVEVGGDILAAYDPRRVDYNFAAETLAALLGDVTVTDATSGALPA